MMRILLDFSRACVFCPSVASFCIEIPLGLIPLPCFRCVGVPVEMKDVRAAAGLNIVLSFVLSLRMPFFLSFSFS